MIAWVAASILGSVSFSDAGGGWFWLSTVAAISGYRAGHRLPRFCRGAGWHWQRPDRRPGSASEQQLLLGRQLGPTGARIIIGAGLDDAAADFAPLWLWPLAGRSGPCRRPPRRCRCGRPRAPTAPAAAGPCGPRRQSARPAGVRAIPQSPGLRPAADRAAWKFAVRLRLSSPAAGVVSTGGSRMVCAPAACASGIATATSRAGRVRVNAPGRYWSA